jgi:hypothetical protein
MMSKTNDKVDSVKKLVLENRGITVREVANMLGILSGLVHGILKDSLNMRQTEDKLVPSSQSSCFVCVGIPG